MGSPLGDFVRAKRDAIQPADLGLPDVGRRRVPGLRRTELASRAGISVEYLTRIEQGRDRHPTMSVLHALADGLSLDARERRHLTYLAKITGGARCVSSPHEQSPSRPRISSSTAQILALLEPGVALATNRLGDVLGTTAGFRRLMAPIGLFDDADANLNQYVFTYPRSRSTLVNWDHVADVLAFDLWMAPTIGDVERLQAELAPTGGADFTRRIDQHLPPDDGPWAIRHPSGVEMRWNRTVLELVEDPDQQVVVFLPADEATASAFAKLPVQNTHLRAL